MGRNKKILVVDDSASVRQQVSIALMEAGFEVLEAVNGVDGLEKITRNGDLAVVLCDINMPGMNGLDLLDRVRSGGQYAGLPILMLTTEGHPALILRAKQAGAKGWIMKPFKTDLLVATVRRLAAS